MLKKHTEGAPRGRGQAGWLVTLAAGTAVAAGCAAFGPAHEADRAVEKCRVSCATRGMYLRGLFQRPVLQPRQVGCICVASRQTRPPDKTPPRWYAPLGQVCPNFPSREACQRALPHGSCQQRLRGSALMKDCGPAPSPTAPARPAPGPATRPASSPPG